MKLPDAQVAVLEAASATDPKPTEQLAAETDLDPNAVAGAAFALEADGLVDVEARTAPEFDLTDEGREYLENGLPEIRLFDAAVAAGFGPVRRPPQPQKKKPNPGIAASWRATRPVWGSAGMVIKTGSSASKTSHR